MKNVPISSINIVNKETDEVNAESIQKQLLGLQESIRKAAATLFEQFADISKPIERIQEILAEIAINIPITDKEAYKILRKYKWIISPSMSIDFVIDVIKIGKKKGNQRGKIDRKFINYYTNNDCEALIEMSRVWKKNRLLKPRMKIINDCIELLRYHHQSINPSNIIIPALLSQIDGILSDYSAKKGIQRKAKDWKIEFRKNVNNNQLVEYSMELANELLLEYLFQKSIPGKPLENPFSFNRHKIIHGEIIKYGRIDNSIRSFLIIDYLSYCD
jgi:hypothetical protein